MRFMLNLFGAPSMKTVDEAHERFVKTTNRSRAASRLSSNVARKVVRTAQRIENAASEAVKEIRGDGEDEGGCDGTSE